jgi:mannan endo-1,4-beta-mannosidase
LGRENKITGLQYNQDVSIMSWDIMNEPRCPRCRQGLVGDFLKAMAVEIKALDSNHMGMSLGAVFL